MAIYLVLASDVVSSGPMEPSSQGMEPSDRRELNMSPARSVVFGPMAIALLGVVAALLMLEVGFRFVSGFLVPKRWSDRPRFYYKPEASATLQDYAYSATKPTNTFRVVVAGDSFTFGPWLQFDDTFSKRLERMLNLNAASMRAEVINKGVAGYSTRDEVNVVKSGVGMGADLILLEITLNDPELQIYQPQPGEDPRFGPLRIDAGHHPLLYYWQSLGFVAQRIRALQTQRRYKQYYFDLFSNDETWGPFKRAIEEVAQIGERNGTKVAAVVFPLFSFNFNDGYPFRDIHQKVGALLESVHMPHLDLLDIYSGIPVERLHVVPGKDQHPNEIAHRLAAEKMYTWLTEAKLIPAELQIKDAFQQRQNYKAFAKDRCEKNVRRCFGNK